METEYIVEVRQAKMPTTCWGRYGRVALMEVEAGTKPKMISERARGVVRIVALRDRLFWGKSDDCALWRAYYELLDQASELNGA